MRNLLKALLAVTTAFTMLMGFTLTFAFVQGIVEGKWYETLVAAIFNLAGLGMYLAFGSQKCPCCRDKKTE